MSIFTRRPPLQVFSVEFCDIFQKRYLLEDLSTIASSLIKQSDIVTCNYTKDILDKTYIGFLQSYFNVTNNCWRFRWNQNVSHPVFTCLRATMETSKQSVKSVEFQIKYRIKSSIIQVYLCFCIACFCVSLPSHSC